ncbi:MAG: 3-hydroxyacyl-ACP dehydratase [Proteobacteria bacterium]|nr:3-hydroxyacyl-ACP dehydratase [Pseudomonadota bacterium]
MKFAGIDIGSRSIELVVVEKGKIVKSLQEDTGFDPMAKARAMLREVPYDRIMATGYGRNLFEISFDAATVTEIKAYARGARELFPHARTVLDIGGQDTKAIALSENGKVKKFEMNDRCAAGTGKFLEIMARALGFTIEEFGTEALKAEKNLSINSMCTVFAESEVTTLIAKGESPLEIAKGLHMAVAKRSATMLKRISLEDPLVFAGGVANNICMRHLLTGLLGRDILVPEYPQGVGALGAALLAGEA